MAPRCSTSTTTKLNLDITTDVRFRLNGSSAGIIARRADMIRTATLPAHQHEPERHVSDPRAGSTTFEIHGWRCRRCLRPTRCSSIECVFAHSRQWRDQRGSRRHWLATCRSPRPDARCDCAEHVAHRDAPRESTRSFWPDGEQRHHDRSLRQLRQLPSHVLRGTTPADWSVPAALPGLPVVSQHSIVLAPRRHRAHRVQVSCFKDEDCDGLDPLGTYRDPVSVAVSGLILRQDLRGRALQ